MNIEDKLDNILKKYDNKKSVIKTLEDIANYLDGELINISGDDKQSIIGLDEEENIEAEYLSLLNTIQANYYIEIKKDERGISSGRSYILTELIDFIIRYFRDLKNFPIEPVFSVLDLSSLIADIEIKNKKKVITYLENSLFVSMSKNSYILFIGVKNVSSFVKLYIQHFKFRLKNLTIYNRLYNNIDIIDITANIIEKYAHENFENNCSVYLSFINLNFSNILVIENKKFLKHHISARLKKYLPDQENLIFIDYERLIYFDIQPMKKYIQSKIDNNIKEFGFDISCRIKEIELNEMNLDIKKILNLNI